jgi:two-component system, LuxR family, response regulator FixJ
VRNEPMSLAIVDDDEDVRSALARLLRCLGHDVRVFASAEAFEADTVAVDCLIVDARLPGLSGPELCERLRSKGTLTPVVLITGDTDPKARDTSRAREMPTVVKPFDDVTLMAAIAAAISSADSLRERHAR